MPRWMKIALAAVATAVFFVSAIPAVIETAWATDRMQTVLERSTGRKARIGSITFSWIHGLEAKRIVVHQKDERDEELGPLIRIPSLSMSISIADLFRRRLQVDSVIAKQPVITIVRDEQGRFNVDDLFSRPGRPSREIFASFIIKDGHISVRDEKADRTIHFEHVDSAGELDRRTVAFDAQLEVNHGKGSVRGTFDFTQTPVAYRLAEVKLEDVDLDGVLPGLALLLPGIERWEGTLDLQLRDLRGRGFDQPQLAKYLSGRGEVTLTGGAVIDSRLRAVLAEIAGIAGERIPGIARSEFMIGNGRVMSDAVRLSSGGLEVVMNGETRFDGQLDWVIAAPGHPALRGLHVRLLGTLEDPRLSVDPRDLVDRKAGEVLQERAGQIFDRIIRGTAAM